MLNTTDTERLRELSRRDPEAGELIRRLIEDQQFTISSISHELRNPLTIIHGAMQLLETEHPEITSYELWSRIREDVLQMRRLLEDLSSYNNRNRLKESTFSAEDFLYNIADSFYYALMDDPDADIMFESDIAPDLPAITGDADKLRECLLNLLDNARDAVSPSGRICLSASSAGRFLRIAVADNGSGITPEHIAHIFKPFITYKKQGTGLGLPIVKSIIEAHGGTVEIARTSSAGTTFVVTLPIT